MRVTDRDLHTRVLGGSSSQKPVTRQDGQSPTFSSVLDQAQARLQAQFPAGPVNAGVVFSKHAEERLRQWGRQLDSEQVQKLGDAMSAARAKGARSTLVLMKGVAFIVAPENRTVVTVVPEDRMRENVFTSIDSAVIVDNR